MTIVEDAVATLREDYVDRAKAIAHILREEAEPSEHAGDVTERAAQALRDQELFWMFVPRELGGGQVDIATGIRVIEEVASADGSIGWVLMATSVGTRNSSFFMAEEGRQELYGDGRRSICAGYAAPLGRGVEVEGGAFGGAERLHFGSGSTYATHLAVTFRVFDADGNQKFLGPGAPDIRTAFMPKEQIKLLGNWDVMGLVATGSYDYSLSEQLMPEKYTLRSGFWADPSKPVIGAELDRAAAGFAGHVGVALGLMKRGLEEVANLVEGKTRQGYDAPVAEHALFLDQFSKADAQYQAVRAYALDVFSQAEAMAHEQGEVSADLTARIRQVTGWAHQVGTEVVNFCALWGGTQTFRNPSALGRLARDMTVARNHLAADPISMVQSAQPILAAWRTP